MRLILLLPLVALGFCACASTASNSGPVAIATPVNRMPSDLVHGKLIFTTGKGSNGLPITANPPATRPTCAACHRANGAGGVHFPDGAVSADLRHKAFVTNQKHPYTLALLERAISSGIDNEGKPLDSVMPRWKLSKRDLHDVAAYVLTLK